MTDGLRQSLAEEFSSIYVLHLRGNACTSGEKRRKEGDNVFQAGGRAPVAITLLVKNPTAAEFGRIRFHDIGDYLRLREKLDIVSRLGSIRAIERADDWLVVKPDDEGNWVKQGESEFEQFFPLASKDDIEAAIFPLYSAGMKTNRDAWC